MTDQPLEVQFRIEGTAEDAVRKIQLRAWQILTVETPVDIGFARSAWTPSVGSPVEARLDRPKSDAEARSAASKRLSENRAKANEIAASYRLQQGNSFLTNPVDYMQYLNAGSSAQAPANFIERGLITAVRSLGGSA